MEVLLRGNAPPSSFRTLTPAPIIQVGGYGEMLASRRGPKFRSAEPGRVHQELDWSHKVSDSPVGYPTQARITS